MFEYKTSFGVVFQELDINHCGQVITVGLSLDGRQLDLDDEADLCFEIEREINRIDLEKHNSQFVAVKGEEKKVKALNRKV
jgi:hypothetical protein